MLLVLALLLSFLRPWASRFFLLLGIATFWGLGVPVGARLLVAPLETRYPVPPAVLRTDAAVVLAGTVDLARSTPDRVELYDRPERIIEGAELVRGGRAGWLVISGGSGDPLRPEAVTQLRECRPRVRFGQFPDRRLHEREVGLDRWRLANMPEQVGACARRRVRITHVMPHQRARDEGGVLDAAGEHTDMIQRR